MPLVAKQVLNGSNLLSMSSESSTRRPVLNFWPTYGLRTDHSVGFIGFVVWFFCKLPAINAAFCTTSTEDEDSDIRYQKERNARDGGRAFCILSG